MEEEEYREAATTARAKEANPILPAVEGDAEDGDGEEEEANFLRKVAVETLRHSARCVMNPRSSFP